MLKLYNTLTRKLEAFKPRQGKLVGMYTCGPTVYNTAHLGNLRTYIFEDILRRTLEFDGYTVKHVMNVTDVGHLTSDADTGEDKIEAQAKKDHQSAHDIAAVHAKEFFLDLTRLNILKPTTVLYATKTIDLQIALVAQLEKQGYTYVTPDGVYFDTAKFSRYGQLSGQRAQDKKAGARVEINPDKHHPSDFALWKFSKPEDHRQMEWDSPWGRGFPGWHLECSAMSMHELGPQFDIHCGGVDHIPVHHENEIAQSEAATGKHPFVKYWLHGEFMQLPDKRMGKSEGNAITLQNVIDKGIDPLAFRYLALQTHYRQKMNFSWEALEAAAQGLKDLQVRVSDLGSEAKIGCAEFEQEFQSSINDDLNTAKALAVVQETLKSEYPNPAKRQSLNIMDQILGLGFQTLQKPEFTIPAETQNLLDQREQARQQGDFVMADKLRAQILKAGYAIEDTEQGPRLRKK